MARAKVVVVAIKTDGEADATAAGAGRGVQPNRGRRRRRPMSSCASGRRDRGVCRDAYGTDEGALNDGSIEDPRVVEERRTLARPTGSTDADTLTRSRSSSRRRAHIDESLRSHRSASVKPRPRPQTASTWPRISPSGYWAVWTLKYHCAAEQFGFLGIGEGGGAGEIGLASEPSIGTARRGSFARVGGAVEVRAVPPVRSS